MRAKDDSDFVEFFVVRAASVRRAAYALCGDWHQAEDLTQTTFARVYAVWPRIRAREAVNAYVHRTLVRTYLNEGRRGWRERPTAELPDRPRRPGDSGSPGDSGGSADDRLLLHAALDQVAPRQRACLVLRFLLDYNVEATAEALGCSAGTVKSQTARGLRTLREVLGDETPALTPLHQEGTP